MAAVARLVLLVAALMATGAAWDLNMIRLPTVRATEEAAAHLQEGVATPLIHALHPLLGSAGDLGRLAGVPCDSWRLAVEAYNKRDWKTVPANCKDYVGHYMLGQQYRRGLPRRRRRGHRVRRGAQARRQRQGGVGV